MSDPAAADPRDPLQPGSALREGRFAITSRLGEGGQATTFDAIDKRDGRRVIVKRFRVRGASSWKEVELAEREAKVLAAIRHPNLPVYVDHFEEAGSLYLVTERIEGDTIAALREHGPLAETDVLRFLRDASDALDYLHGRSPPLVHRDVKPSNVLRRPDGSFAIIDFGAVRDRLKTTGSTVVGTFGYMAPEQFQGRAMPASDVYAVGTTAIAMLTGREPEDLPHKGLAIDVEAALGPFMNASLTRALAAMVEPDPDRRAPRIAPLLADLRSSPPAARRESRPAPEPQNPFNQADPRPRDEARKGGSEWWKEPSRWENTGLGEEAGREAQRAVNEAEEQVKRVVEEVGEQVRRVVAEVSAGHSDGARREARRVAEVAKREAKRAFKEAKRAARSAGESARVAEQERRAAAERARAEAQRARAAAREAERRARSERRRNRPLGGPILLVVLLALTLAQLAVLLGLKVITPVVLYVVSALFFGSIPGRAMRAAAGHVSAAGSRASAAIGRAKDVVRGRVPTPPPSTSQPSSAPGSTPVRVLGTGPVSAHARTDVSHVDHVDPYAPTHISSISRKDPNAAPARRFPEDRNPPGPRIPTDDFAEDEAAAEEEAAQKDRGARRS